MNRKSIGRLLCAVHFLLCSVALAHAEKPSIVATIGMIGDATERIAGGRADVSTLMGAGVDPHSYRQTRSDIVRLGQADLIFSNGLYLEAQLEGLLKRLAVRQKVVVVGESVDKARLLRDTVYEDKFDPHIWMDVALWSEAIDSIRLALTEMDPQGASIYEANTLAYRAELARLDGYVRGIVATIPEEGRIVITAHDAFSYFGRAYGVEVVGIQGLSTESEAGLRRIEELVDLIVARDLKAVFVESSVSERNVRALVEGAAARGQTVIVGAELFSDAMGIPGSYEGTYFGMIDHNATKITLALGGEAPERGLGDRLGAGL